MTSWPSPSFKVWRHIRYPILSIDAQRILLEERSCPHSPQKKNSLPPNVVDYVHGANKPHCRYAGLSNQSLTTATATATWYLSALCSASTCRWSSIDSGSSSTRCRGRCVWARWSPAAFTVTTTCLVWHAAPSCATPFFAILGQWFQSRRQPRNGFQRCSIWSTQVNIHTSSIRLVGLGLGVVDLVVLVVQRFGVGLVIERSLVRLPDGALSSQLGQLSLPSLRGR